MGSALNELSDFCNDDLVKCGEIALSVKQNAFAFTCIQCKQLFSQMVVFARHVRLEHQVGAEVINKFEKELQDLSVYTLEELLSDQNESGLSDAGTSISKEGDSTTISDSYDTGIDSDVELEKEISELLASIATTSDSYSLTGTEFSDDSGLDSKNMSDDNRSESQHEYQSNVWEAQATDCLVGEQHTKVNGKRDTKVKNQDTKAANMPTHSTAIAFRSGSKRDSTTVTKKDKNTIKENYNLSKQSQKPERKCKYNQKYINYAKLNNKIATSNPEHKYKLKAKLTTVIKKHSQEKHTRTLADFAVKKVKVVVESNEELENDLNNEIAFRNDDKYKEISKELEINCNDCVKSVNVAKCGGELKVANEEIHKEQAMDVNYEVQPITGLETKKLHKELEIDVYDEIEHITGAKCKELHTECDIDLNYEIERITGSNCEQLHEELDIDFNDELGSNDQVEELHNKIGADLSEQLGIAREVEESNITEIVLPDTRDMRGLEQTDKPLVIVGVDDELAGIKFSMEEISDIRSDIPEMTSDNFKKVDSPYELEKSVHINGLSAYQMQYLIYNEKKAQMSIACSNDDDKSTISAETGVTAPLDLSLNKSADFADMQEEISELLPNLDAPQCQITNEILIEVENLLAQQDTINLNDNTTPSYETNELLNFDGSADTRQLPPFSKVFKNTANSLRSSNGAFAQSTPKQKPLKNSIEKKQTKIASPLRPKAQLNIETNGEDSDNRIETGNNAVHFSKKSVRQPNLKRVLQTNDKENDAKKQKIYNEAVHKKDTQLKDCDPRKKELEILKIEVLPPHATIADRLKLDLKNLKLPSTNKPQNNAKRDSSIENIKEDLISYVKMKEKSDDCSSQVVADSITEKCMTSFNELNYTPEDSLNQLKLEQFVDDKTLYDSLLRNSFVDSLNSSTQLASLIGENSFMYKASTEEKDNYQLLRPLGLSIIVDPNVEDGIQLKTLETIRAKARLFATIYTEFKYLWKVGKGIKSFERLELDFNKLMQRINEHYQLELTITETKRIINLISLWHMQSYNRTLIKKKLTSESVLHYLQFFLYLPKTARRIFYCEECPRYFLSQQNYLAHRDKHMAMPITCPYCQTNYATRKDLKQHTKVCVTFTCIECDCNFGTAADLEYHLRNEHLWQCEACGRLAATSLDLETHEHQHPIICGLCNHLFDSAAELQKHRQDSFHWDYTCNKCEVFLPTATQMKHHSMLCNIVRT